MNEKEEYLSTSIDTNWLIGYCMEAILTQKKKVNINFFKNNDKTNDNQPDYKFHNGALWKKQKKEEETKVSNEIV